MIVLLLMKSSIVLGSVDEGVIQANKNVETWNSSPETHKIPINPGSVDYLFPVNSFK